MIYDVCAAVISDLSVDARVWREALSLQTAGRSVKLIGCGYDIDHVRRRVQDGVNVVEVPVGSHAVSPSRRRRAIALLTVWREIVKTRALAYHSHNIHVMPACWVAGRQTSARLVYDAHELYGEPRTGVSLGGRIAARISRAIEGFAVRNADAVITTNPSRALALQARHGLCDIRVLANVPRLVADLEPWDPGFPQGVPILLYQGGIYAEERPFRQCIEALSLLDDVHFVIVGFGRDRQLALIRQWADEAGVTNRVHILPPVPFERLVATAAMATVGIVPLLALELGYLLGDTNKLHEYLMAGLPVIASDMPEVRRVATQGNPPVGELFDASDPTSIAAAYRKVVDDPEMYQRRRAEARRLAVEQHHWGIEEQRLLAIYDQLVGSSPHPGDVNTRSDETLTTFSHGD
jgi:glycosyltransferase involved in cell wall biosynthesis